MRQGSFGRTFAQELWNRQEVGILFGTWSAAEVLEGGRFAEEKWKRLAKAGQLPPGIENGAAKGHVQRFIEAKRGDWVFWSDSATLHWGRFADSRLYDGKLDPPCTTEHWGESPARIEQVKARRIDSIQSAKLADLPAVFRLFRLTGRGTFQKMTAYAPWAHALAVHGADGLNRHLEPLEWNEWLGLLTPGGWEALVAEYLRGNRGARSLAVSDGRTLPGVDLVMFLPELEGRASTRLLVQCKNDSKPWTKRKLETWLRDTFEEAADQGGPLEEIMPADQEVIVANRGGFHDDAKSLAASLTTLKLLGAGDVENWLAQLNVDGNNVDRAWMHAIRTW